MMVDATENRDNAIRVFCVDDHAFLIEGLCSRLEKTPNIEVVGTLPSADGLIEAASKAKPDVVLLDIEMPGSDPFEVIDDLRSRCPDCRVILLSAFVRHSYLDAAVKVGAWGYVSKRDAPAAIIDAIKQVAGGRFAFSPEVISRCGLDPNRPLAAESNKPESKLNRLTQRELQILRMIGRGMPRNEIANAIHRSPKTVDAHRSSIMDKLGLHDRVELARFAIREGLVEI
ncbi:MAG: response regulator transcription factor [Phycisphaeraceae bacterium]|nr:MAG: response regulator transcription factor [Phycisphaeraceae bacterium]